MNKYIVRFYDYDFNETWNTILYGNSFMEAFDDFKNKFQISIHETGESFTIDCYEDEEEIFHVYANEFGLSLEEIEVL